MHFDIQTVLASEIALCALLTLMIRLATTQVRGVKGVNQISASFLATGLGVSAFLLRGFTPLWANVPFSNALYSASNLLLYAGVAILLRTRYRLRVPIAAAALLTASLVYFSAPGQTVLRLTIITATDVLLRAPLLALLVRQRSRGAVVRLLAASVATFMTVDLLRIATTLRFGTTGQVFQYTFIQSAYITFSLLMTVTLGVLCLALVYRESVLAVEQSARMDPLTQVLNRLGVEERLLSEVLQSQRNGAPLCIALADVDHFKKFNDNDGHAAGDDVLSRVATAITQALQPSHACGRLGGDEFLLLFPGLDVHQARSLCEGIRRSVAALPPYPKAGIAPSVSIGVAVTAPGDTVELLLERADRALYEAKHAGKNCVRGPATAERPSGTRTTTFQRMQSPMSGSQRTPVGNVDHRVSD